MWYKLWNGRINIWSYAYGMRWFRTTQGHTVSYMSSDVRYECVAEDGVFTEVPLRSETTVLKGAFAIDERRT